MTRGPYFRAASRVDDPHRAALAELVRERGVSGVARDLRMAPITIEQIMGGGRVLERTRAKLERMLRVAP